MSPLVLVGLVTLTALASTRADVKHVLDGTAHPPACTLEGDHQHHHHQGGSSNSYNSAGFTTSGSFGGNPGEGASVNFNANGAGNNGVPGSVAFWWMDSNSPFKHAYEYFKKCSLKGNCLPPVAPGFQLPKDLPQNGCTGSGCTVSGSFEYKTESNGFGPIDVKKNIFLNGQYQGAAGSGQVGGTGCNGGACNGGAGSGQVSFNVHGQGNGAKEGGQFSFNGQNQGTTGAGFGTGCSGAGCKTESGHAYFSSQSTSSHSQGGGQVGGGCSGSSCTAGSGQLSFNGHKQGPGQINLSGNPFLNGGVTASGTTGTTSSSFGSGTGGGHIDISGNPFLGGGSSQSSHSSTQSAYSGNGQAVVTGSDGFLGVQPSVPFGKNTNKQSFSTTHPNGGSSQGSLQYSFEHSSQTGGQSFPTTHPVNDGKAQNCKEAGYVCVAQHLCVNGVVSSHGQGQVHQKNSYCQIGKEVCCRLSETATTGSSYSSFSTASQFTTTGSRSGFANLSDITAGKSSIPGSVIKFGGGAGLSPGSIQVLTVNDGAPNPLVSTAGESGSGIVHAVSPNSIKVVRNTSPNPVERNPFSSTIDYSNDKLDQLSFISTTKGPEYLPPVKTPQISTYRPEIPTTPRPLITKPIIPGSSVVTTYVPSSPKPFDIPHQSQSQNIIPSYTPKPFPTTNNQYIPPSSPKPFVTYPQPQPSYTTTTKQPYYPTSSSNVNNNFISSRQPPSSQGYSYPTPTPTFGLPTTTKKTYYQSSTNVNTNYVPPQTSASTGGYSYSTPPTTRYPTTTRQPYTTRKYVPPSVSTPGYRYPTPTPKFEESRPPVVTVTQSTNVNNNYITPKQPTGGYSYPTPSPSFPTPARIVPTPPRTNNGYLPPAGPTLIPSGSGIGNNYVPPPYIPPDRTPGPSGKVIVSVAAGCAAALQCVEEQFCTADGFISSSPVALTREQELARVPTTDCNNNGRPGKCCRDSNYVDPWPSANLINGEDNGQYREDDSLGQYFPQKQRPARSGQSSNGQNAVANTGGSSFGPGSISKLGSNDQSAAGGRFGSSFSKLNVEGQNAAGNGLGGSFGQNSFSKQSSGQNGAGFGGQSGAGFAGQNGAGAGGQNAAGHGFGGSYVQSSFSKVSAEGQNGAGFGGQREAGAGGQNAAGQGFGGSFVQSSFTKQSSGQNGAGFGGQNGAGFAGQNAGGHGFGGSFVQSSFTKQSSEGQNGAGFGGQNGAGHGVGASFGQSSFSQQGGSGQGLATGKFGGSFGQGSQSAGFGKSSSSSSSYFQQYSAQGQVASGSGNCGVRHLNTKPEGPGPIDAGFAEIPWQAMILRDSNRSLLCGGVIVQNNAVLTYAHCVEGLETSDVLIKGGEWKLGIDEEPLPFQIVGVAAIIYHPQYQSASREYDLALLMLEENLRFADNIGPICLPPPNQPAPSVSQLPAQQCIVTGWGKRILQVHLRNAIMRTIDVNVAEGEQCKAALGSKDQSFLSQYYESTICGYSNNNQCDVDYGSALACTNEHGSYTLAGIFLWDTGCKDQSQVGAYIRPDYEWIHTTCSKSLSELRAIDRQYRHK